MKNEQDWKKEARKIVKAEIARRDLSYSDVRQKLLNIGVDKSVPNITSRINTGGFSFVFFLQLAKALDINHVTFNQDI